MTTALKSLAARLPASSQQTLKRWHFRRQIAAGTFTTAEPEYARLKEWITPGDWVVDIGANVGHYTYKLSELVGPSGCVLAFEPVPETFALLTQTVERCPYPNVRPLNMAVSSDCGAGRMAVPVSESGLANYYRAELTADGPIPVLTISLDAFCVGHRISLVKIDAEGHEADVLAGMRALILQSKPVLIVETHEAAVIGTVVSMGYFAERLPGSPNVLFRPR